MKKKLLFNPNAALCDHLEVGLTVTMLCDGALRRCSVAVLCGRALDLKLRGGQISGDLAATGQLYQNSYYASPSAWLIRGDNNNNNTSVADQWMDYALRRQLPFMVRLRPALEACTFCVVDQCSPSPTVHCGGGSTTPPNNTTLPAGLTLLAPIWSSAI